jgi:Asp-tRNA(Asn)/Glu-tRNA(Gln) amidotransferase A subunit family amidase
VSDLRQTGVEIVDPVVIADLKPPLAKRARSVRDDDAMFELYFKGGKAPFETRAAAMASPLFQQVVNSARRRWSAPSSAEQELHYLKARDTLMINKLKVMADHRLDAIDHKAVEHQPTLIRDGVNPPHVDQKGAPHINTFLMFVPSIVVPAGFTRDNLPAGITFLARPYADAKMIQTGLCLRAGNTTAAAAIHHALVGEGRRTRSRLPFNESHFVLALRSTPNQLTSFS